MTKQTEHDAMELVRALYEEMDRLHRSYSARNLAYSYKWLDSYVRTRGVIQTLCIEFPKIGKAFDKSLSIPSGEYVPPKGVIPSSPQGKHEGVHNLPKNSVYCFDEDERTLARGLGEVIGLTHKWYTQKRGGGYRYQAMYVTTDHVPSWFPDQVFLTRTLLYGFKKLEQVTPAQVEVQDRLEFFSVEEELSMSSFLWESEQEMFE